MADRAGQQQDKGVPIRLPRITHAGLRGEDAFFFAETIRNSAKELP
jgi:hypothetical protein